MGKSKGKTIEPVEIQHTNVWGYADSNDVAADISGSIHETLLQGFFVFAYRGEGDLQRLVITRIGEDIWMYGMITSGWTALVPKITREGLISMILPDLVSKKVNKQVIEDFKYYVSQ